MTITVASNSALACPHFPPCSGCPWIPQVYSEQLERKRADLASQLAGVVDEAVIGRTVPSPRLGGYRNQARLVFARGASGRVELGLYAAGTHRVVPIPSCPIQPEGMNSLARAIGLLARRLRLTVYDERSRRGHLRYLALRTDHRRRRYHVGIVAAGDDPRLRSLATRLERDHPEIGGVTLWANASTGNIIFAGHEVWTIGERRLPDRIGRAEVEVSMTSFLQANHEVAGWICRRIEERLAGESGVILDLYAGVGAIAFHLAGPGRSVIAVEESAGAVADGQAAAERTGVAVRWETASVERFLADAPEHALESEGRTIAAAVLNPPRAGCSPEVIQALCNLAPRLIAYVSCKPATLARDLALFAPDYTIEEVTPVDMLPLTPHIEALVFLRRRPDRDRSQPQPPPAPAAGSESRTS